MADSFIRFSISAPVNPGVRLASILRSTSSAKGLPLECTFKISSRPLTSGTPTTTCLSKRPGLNRAGSRISGLLVAASIIMPSFTPKPSISTNSWFNVCSLSSWPPPSPAPRCRPTASISSINTIHGVFFFACSNRSLTLEAPTPTNISTKSEPLMLKKGTPASPATALANRVLPVPGGPTNSTPLGILAPSSTKRLGFFKNSTISLSSSFSSSAPATSSNVTRRLLSVCIFARLLPKLITLLPPPWDCCIKKNQKTKNNMVITINGSKDNHQAGSGSGWLLKFILPSLIKGCISCINIFVSGT